jgi:HAD superfamily hydrolase (TIGR01509 family)
MAKAVIFDFDGVLVDSETHWPGLNARIFERLNIAKPWTKEYNDRIVGHGMESVHRVLTTEYGLTMPLPEYESIVWEEAIHVYDTLAMPIPGVVALLERLKTTGMPMAIGSSNERDVIQETCARLGLGTYFREIATRNDVPSGRIKPCPDIYLHAARSIGATPETCLAIEDSPTGIAAAKAAGMTCIALHSAHNEAQDMSAADIHINGFDELNDERLASLLGYNLRA